MDYHQLLHHRLFSSRSLFSTSMDSKVQHVLLVFFSLWSLSDADYYKFDLDGKILTPMETGIFKLDPELTLTNNSSERMSKFPLVLAEERTKRPDVLQNFRTYNGGWDITNKHYWTSVAFTGIAAFVLAILWLISFGMLLVTHRFCKCRVVIKDKDLSRAHHIFVILLLIFTCGAGTGCLLLSIGQHELHVEALSTVFFVVNQSEFTVQILRNVTDFLSLAKNINVDQVNLPSDVQNKIDKLNVDLNDTASTLSSKTDENSAKLKEVLDQVRCALLVTAAVMFSLTVVGLVLSILGQRSLIYLFIIIGWILVALTLILCGVFIILNNAVSDTCTAMDEWVKNPQAETALSNILPCIDEQTSNHSLLQSKEVITQLVNVVDIVINTIANADITHQQNASYFYNQSGPLMPPLCSPYDSQLDSQKCNEASEQVSLDNASSVWLDYICVVSDSGSCISSGRVTPDIYQQLVVAVNATYALDHYTPLLLSFQNCSFVRDTFNEITNQHCPPLELNLGVVAAGLGIISVGIMSCLVLWILFANCIQTDEVKENQAQCYSIELDVIIGI